jgi:hypothetical protein
MTGNFASWILTLPLISAQNEAAACAVWLNERFIVFLSLSISSCDLLLEL